MNQASAQADWTANGNPRLLRPTFDYSGVCNERNNVLSAECDILVSIPVLRPESRPFWSRDQSRHSRQCDILVSKWSRDRHETILVSKTVSSPGLVTQCLSGALIENWSLIANYAIVICCIQREWKQILCQICSNNKLLFFDTLIPISKRPTT